MSATARPFALERRRIALLRTLFAFMIPILLVLHPLLAGGPGGEVMETAGIWLIVTGVLGRMWSILYIGGSKSLRVVQDGPYSICRHPLYLFSTIAIFGFGLMLQSLLFAVVLTIVVFLILNATATREETRLRAMFGTDYDDYAAQTPRILPNISLFRTQSEVTFLPAQLRINLLDGIGFLLLIPLAEVLEYVHALGVLPMLPLP